MPSKRKNPEFASTWEPSLGLFSCTKGLAIMTEMSDYVKKVLADAPPLDDERRERLTQIFANWQERG